MSHLDHKLSDLLISKEHLGRNRKGYLENLKEVLDLYLFSVMEEENSLYNLLHERSEYVCSNYKNLKTLSPFCIQLRILMTLPFHHNQVKVEKSIPGHVKLKLPADAEAEITSSRVWRNACNRGIQKSLLRHIDSWRDNNSYLKSTAFLNWFGGVVDESLLLTGSIPYYHITRTGSQPGKVVLSVDDLQNGISLSVVLLPVLSFPLSQLPEDFTIVPQDQSCTEWMAECRSNVVCNEQSWGISLWQHEQMIFRENEKLKPALYALKSLRDGCGWYLNNYQLRTLVMQTFKQDPSAFALQQGELVLHLLLELRNRLVSREGLPFLWDAECNLLCGLTGQVKSGLARAVTKTRESLQNPDTDFENIFRPHIYKLSENDLNLLLEPTHESPSSPVSPSQSSSNGGAPSHPSTPPVHRSHEQVSPAPGPEQSQRNVHHNEVFGENAQSPPPSGVSNGMVMEDSTDWWTIGFAGAGALAVSVIAGFAMLRNRNHQS
ncbi:hypothetical protein ONE63_004228 [Megalurothrips usitatus]|uniref:Uncharacterized protein n=1 Tax=Megalurothrips usitatus TaxID=439358 RepID=A0AAV7X6D5_9NEOP|nr:hypothetical protein ONE63_004228 [Megalurothrips usitatus]